MLFFIRLCMFYVYVTVHFFLLSSPDFVLYQYEIVSSSMFISYDSMCHFSNFYF